MLNCQPDNLLQEVTAAIALRQKHIGIMNEMIGRYATDFYREDWEAEGASIENHEFEFLVNILPAILASNPAVSVKSRRPVVQRELVQAMQHGINRWIKDINLADRLEPVVVDAVFKFGALVITLEPLPGHEHKDTPPLRPALRRVSPRMFFIDPQASGIHDARYVGHVFLRDRDDLKNAKGPDGKPKYNAEILADLEGEGSGNKYIGPKFHEDLNLKVDRDQVIGAEIFVREKQMIYTIAFSTIEGKERKAHYLREPRKFFGHPAGPYVPFGFYIVPDQVYPLSPLCVTAESVEEINAHADQTRRQASTSRNLVIVDSMNTGMLDAVKNYADGTVAGIPHFDKNAFAEISLGGPNPEQLDYIERLRARIDRRSGLTDIQRGQISGDATATEAQLAAAAASGRVRFMQKQMRRAVQQILERVAYLMFHSDSIVFPVSEEKAEKMVFEDAMDGSTQIKLEGTEEEDKRFYGGIQPGQEDFSFFDLELEIDPYSMEQVDEAVLQKRMEIATMTVVKFAPMMLQFPIINWPELLDDYFQALNIPDGRKYINFEMLSKLMGMQFAAGAPQGIPGLDGAPAVDTSSFKGAPGMPAGLEAQSMVNNDQGGGGGASAAVQQIAGMLGSANAA